MKVRKLVIYGGITLLLATGCVPGAQNATNNAGNTMRSAANTVGNATRNVSQ
ncbi:hypothetical protein NZD89_14140 [Alicyclobacillus fastidiosus]|uniref:Entericidin n=1 Tax=Alicyclobacillus fastidiosus TaxID=392011 RepID=A0ABY6ZNL9_9BACL|nr:hypothetical protein [Alicyclobacillus fastidiosus]WAH44427.1 hypothetical protein NZD89_14140 [Alicyclobacillus fastidiosus]GMA60768.1 hypothetical protein GCM10025859_12080 [Alicyclobacillus fastidiosus]